jgi:putative transposase
VSGDLHRHFFRNASTPKVASCRSSCLSALDWALQRGRPEIFNSDQGSQFASEGFTGRLQSLGIRISMDGWGRVFDNIFVERLWRTVKFEEVYLKDYESVPAAVAGLSAYFSFYNQERLHQALGYRTSAVVYHGRHGQKSGVSRHGHPPDRAATNQ